ncbi:MAG: hypothetical protein GXO91_01640 [FCB group bacterium]|nr:hypothetical protein [FCB group bacterium]
MLFIRSSLIIALFCFSFGISQDRDRIIFPHEIHIVDAELVCSDCHSSVDGSTTLAESLLPEMEVCSECHEVEEDCGVCHSNPDNPKSYLINGNSSGFDFPHKSHLIRFADCNTCHAEVVNDGVGIPRQVWPASKCSDCHRNNKPSSHALNWRVEHGAEVSLPQSRSCTICHNENFCDNCHQMQQFTPRQHPTAYLLKHGFEASMEMLECETCHQIDNDCRQCHQQQNVMPVSHSNFSWVNSTFNEGGLHGEAVEDSPELCRVCHTSDSCQRSGCHAGGSE